MPVQSAVDLWCRLVWVFVFSSHLKVIKKKNCSLCLLCSPALVSLKKAIPLDIYILFICIISFIYFDDACGKVQVVFDDDDDDDDDVLMDRLCLMMMMMC